MQPKSSDEIIKELVEYGMEITLEHKRMIVAALFYEDLKNENENVLQHIFEGYGSFVMKQIFDVIWSSDAYTYTTAINALRSKIFDFYFDEVNEKIADYQDEWRQKVQSQNPNDEYNPDENN